MSGRPWIYGQFRDVVIPAVCHILDNLTGGGSRQLRPNERGDPVKVSRAVSSAVAEGVLVGRWDGNYGDGRLPSEWTGSVAILEEFMKAGGHRPVKYAQCWVYAGLVTTSECTLGISNYLLKQDFLLYIPRV